ncbi:MAG: glutamate racemase [Rhodoferax sp.]
MMADAPQPQARSRDPIGVFDSGVGGLSVLQALRAELPDERFVYVADSGHAPYGERDDTHVIARSQAITRYLVAQHRIKALVVACNTATAAAILQLRQEFPDLPIVGIEPALKPAAAQSHTRRIGVLATRGTLNSEKFRVLLASLQDQADFVLQACDGLADAIEQNDAIKTEALCVYFTRASGPFGIEQNCVDTLVLGCTHYPFAADILRAQVGESVIFLEGGAPVARQTRRLLAARSWLATEHTLAPAVVFGTTGDPSKMQAAIARWLHEDCEVQSLNIE